MRELYPNRKIDYVLPMDEENVVLIKELHRDEMDTVDEIASSILDTLNSESMAKVHIGIGMPAETLRDCAKSYREANLALTVGGIFEPENYIMRYDRLGLGRLIYQLPSTLCHMFLDEVFPEGSYEQLDSETLLTIDKFFENNLNGSETSPASTCVSSRTLSCSSSPPWCASTSRRRIARRSPLAATSGGETEGKSPCAAEFINTSSLGVVSCDETTPFCYEYQEAPVL